MLSGAHHGAGLPAKGRSIWRFLSWAERGLGKLGKSPHLSGNKVWQVLRQRGWEDGLVHRDLPQGWTTSEEDGVFGAPAPGSIWLLDWWRAGGPAIDPSFILHRELLPTPGPLASFLLLINLSNCHVCAGYQWDWQSEPILRRWQESQTPRVHGIYVIRATLLAFITSYFL